MLVELLSYTGFCNKLFQFKRELGKNPAGTQLYDERSKDWNNAAVDIYLSIKK